MGRIELDNENYLAANRLFEKALDINPESYESLINLGYCYISMRQTDIANQCFIKALQFKSNSAEAFAGIGHCYFLEEKYDLAFQHYRSLIVKGYKLSSTIKNLSVCAENIQADYYDPNLEQDILFILDEDYCQPQRFSNLVCSLLIHKYQLEDPNAQISIQQLAEDRLFLLGLESMLFTNPVIEEVIQLVRYALFEEIYTTEALPDNLQNLCMGICYYNNRTEYALITSDVEMQWVSATDIKIDRYTRQKGWKLEDITGALLSVGMYHSFYHQSYTFKLLGLQLNEWPIATQSLVKAALYIPSEESLIAYDLTSDKERSQLIESQEFSAPFPKWSLTKPYSFIDYNTLISKKLNEAHLPYTQLEISTPKVLVINSPKRAVELAISCQTAQFTLLSQNIYNIAYAKRIALENGLNNIKFIYSESLDKTAITEYDYTTIEIDSRNYLYNSFASQLYHILVPGGVIRFELHPAPISSLDIEQVKRFINIQKTKPTEFLLKDIREAVLKNQFPFNTDKIKNESAFYSLTGCKFLLWKEPVNPNKILAALDKSELFTLASTTSNSYHEHQSKKSQEAQSQILYYLKK